MNELRLILSIGIGKDKDIRLDMYAGGTMVGQGVMILTTLRGAEACIQYLLIFRLK